jgi:hypothetical protein
VGAEIGKDAIQREWRLIQLAFSSTRVDNVLQLFRKLLSDAQASGQSRKSVECSEKEASKWQNDQHLSAPKTREFM